MSSISRYPHKNLKSKFLAYSDYTLAVPYMDYMNELYMKFFVGPVSRHYPTFQNPRFQNYAKYYNVNIHVIVKSFI